VKFTFTSDELNGKTIGVDANGNPYVRPLVPITFTSFSQAAYDNAESRIYLGIHWAFDRDQGLKSGKAVGDAVFALEAAPIPKITLPTDSVVAAAPGTVTLELDRAGDTSGTVTVIASTTDGTARAGTDYVPAQETLTFGPGVTHQPFLVNLLNNPNGAGGRTFSVSLSNATGGAVILPFGTTTLGLTAPAGTNARFVLDTYVTLLGRQAEAGAVEFWGALLDEGMSRTDLVMQVEASLEYRIDEIERMYHTYLRRSADAGDLEGWVAFLAEGGTGQEMEVSILGSPEYFLGQGRGTDAGFMAALYRDVLFRGMDADASQLVQSMVPSDASRALVSEEVVASLEGYDDLVASYYREFLHRQADPAGVVAWVALLRTGMGENLVVAGFLTSKEFEGM
jgi:hypothetical protein